MYGAFGRKTSQTLPSASSIVVDASRRAAS